MEKSKTIVLENDVHAYNYITYEQKGISYHELWRSNSSMWTLRARETLVIGFKDDGNGFKFYERININIDYAKAFAIKILLDIYSSTNNLGPEISFFNANISTV